MEAKLSISTQKAIKILDLIPSWLSPEYKSFRQNFTKNEVDLLWISRDVQVQGFVLIKGEEYWNSEIESVIPYARLLQLFWNKLPYDKYMGDKGKYRRRRLGRFIYDPLADKIQRLLVGAFFQSKKVNVLNGGLARIFADLEDEAAVNPFLQQLIRFYYWHLPIPKDGVQWVVFTHFIRVISDVREVGKPTPEGIHQDGPHYVVQILMNRENVIGAQSCVYSNDLQKIYEITLTHFLDTLVVDDHQVMHEVTPLANENPQRQAIRDMLLIDFNPASEVL